VSLVEQLEWHRGLGALHVTPQIGVEVAALGEDVSLQWALACLPSMALGGQIAGVGITRVSKVEGEPACNRGQGACDEVQAALLPGGLWTSKHAATVWRSSSSRRSTWPDAAATMRSASRADQLARTAPPQSRC
jgi:hypothetical protein